MRGWLALAATVLAALPLPGPVHAPQQPSFSSGALGVRVDVLVTDGRHPVGGLTALDFELRDDGVVQTVTVMDVTDVPVNAVLALDTSASIAGTRQVDLVAASYAFLDGLKAADRAALTTFSHAVAPRIPLTSDIPVVRAELRRIVPSGRTAVLDGVYVALVTTLSEPGRSLVVVCTDGADTSSWLQAEEVLESAKRSNAVIYAVTAADARRSSSLDDLTDATGGQVLQVKSSADLRGAFQKILQQFRSRYTLTYSPEGVPAGGFHRLDVRAKRRGLNVRARQGYIGVGPAK
ncbi:MAG: VWA domain-containing protein [Acidobacteriota bacterium]